MTAAEVSVGTAAVEATGVEVRLGTHQALRGVDVSVPTGSWTSIIGPNGAGKTTLLRVIAGLQRQEAGHVRILDEDAAGIGVRGRAQRMALMPQTPNIPPRMRVIDYVLLGRTPHLGAGLKTGPRDLEVVERTLAAVDLESFAGRRVDQLSGGERQRVVIARALAQEAPILLLDEPTTALDVGHQQDVLETVDRVRSELGVTVLATMHDLGLAAQYSDTMTLLVDGAVVSRGAPRAVLDPKTLSAAYGADLDVTDDDGQLIVVPRRRRH
ncbi:MAG: ABC transporter ATP-binding protein [Actinomycetota bacterium]